MRHLARIGLVAAFVGCALVGGCNKSARVENSASSTKTCATTCSDKSAEACTASKTECSASKTECSGTVAETKASGCCASKDAKKAQN